MKANLSQREPKMVEQWQSNDIYGQIRKQRSGAEKFILHDGPPYANGHLHMGHALNKTLKDIIIKYKTMRGYDAPYIPGWDCHGLPIEHKVIADLEKKGKHDLPAPVIRKICRNYAQSFVDIQRTEFMRLGVFGNWQNPYLTMSKEYEATIIEIFGKLVKEGYIYKGLRPIHWSWAAQTALAEAELEYKDHISPSIYVQFPISQKNAQPLHLQHDIPTFCAIWTTTPWTLPANVAIAIHPSAQYVAVHDIVDDREQYLIMAEDLVPEIFAKIGRTHKSIEKIDTKALCNTIARHPFIDRDVPIVTADYVTLDTGTGLVHTAPGHGMEDYQTGKKYNLPVISPVDNAGRFTDAVPDWAGMNVFDANPKIIKHLDALHMLIFKEDITHSYPHCWRTKKPVIFRATPQWFMRIDTHNLRDNALKSIQQVHWHPARGETRITEMVHQRPDWCLSRQRVWGVPIPAFHCTKCDATILNETTIDHIRTIVNTEGIEVWYTYTAEQLLPAGFTCPECNAPVSKIEKENNILDVWFDSGVSHFAVCEKRDELQSPADMYIEGSDQHRGWFQSSLWPSVALHNRPPYKNVITHGFVLDEHGIAMSKSEGNVIDPLEVSGKTGADIIRLWVASSDYQNDLNFGNTIIDRLTESYRRIRNTARYLLGNLTYFDPKKDALPLTELTSFDKWALLRLEIFLNRVTTAMEEYHFHVFFHALNNFCSVDLSSVYFEVLKDILYVENAADHIGRSARTVLSIIFDVLSRVIAPVLTFTAEEMFQTRLAALHQPEKSIHLQDWPKLDLPFSDTERTELNEIWDTLNTVRAVVKKGLERARTSGMIGQSLDAKVIIAVHDTSLQSFLNEHKDKLTPIFICSQTEIASSAPTPTIEENGITVTIVKADGDKCPRCWHYAADIGTDTAYPELCPRCTSIVKELSKDD